MNMKGGFTNYGQDIGIIMLPTVFPRLPGDIGNARSFKVPVRYFTVQDVDISNINLKNAQTTLVQPFINAAKELEAAGCKAITTSCSFLGSFQTLLANSVKIPVFTSSLIMVPALHAMLNDTLKIGIFTENETIINEKYFNQFGWSSKDIPIHVSGMSPDSEFSRLIIQDNINGNMSGLKNCISDMTKKYIQKYSDTGAIVLECTNYAPFTKLIQDISHVPVFGINQLIEYMDSSINAPVYSSL